MHPELLQLHRPTDDGVRPAKNNAHCGMKRNCESAVTMLLLPHDTPLWSRCNCKFRGGEVEILAEKFKNVSVGVWAQNQNLIHYQCLIRKAP
jgi:hypothetical protein